MEDYKVNIEGTDNVLVSCEAVSSVKHLVVTSSQLVVRPGYLPDSDEDFCPLDDLYSLSKVKTETLTRSSDTSFGWTIIRPTNIWGPRHPRFPSRICKYFYKRWYFHPSIDVRRSHDYVENTASQIANIIVVEKELVDRKVLYIGDEPVFSLNWVDGFSRELTGRKVHKFPIQFFKLAAIFGKFLKQVGVPSTIYMDRYRSMTSEYIVPMGDTFEILGKGSYSVEKAIKKTVNWLRGSE